MKSIKEYEEKIEDLEALEDSIILDGFGYYEGKKYTAADQENIVKLKEKYQKKRFEAINTPLTIEDCSRIIKICNEAEEAVLSGQEYEYEGRRLTRVNLDEIRSLKDSYIKEKYRLENGVDQGIKIYRAFGNNL